MRTGTLLTLLLASAAAPAAEQSPAAAPHVSPARVVTPNLGEVCERYYPTASRREHETGNTTLLVFVGEDGRVSHSRVETSSGFERLDDAAQDCVKREGDFTPQKIDGRPVGSWQRMKWTWKLDEDPATPASGAAGNPFTPSAAAVHAGTPDPTLEDVPRALQRLLVLIPKLASSRHDLSLKAGALEGRECTATNNVLLLAATFSSQLLPSGAVASIYVRMQDSDDRAFARKYFVMSMTQIADTADVVIAQIAAERRDIEKPEVSEDVAEIRRLIYEIRDVVKPYASHGAD